MNIFLTSPDPRECAQALDDKRVVKMALESAQLLHTTLRLLGREDASLYKATHTTHPCSKWAGRSRSNFLWLVEHGLELCGEYEFRYDRRRVHKSKAAIYEAFELCEVVPAGPLVFDFNSSGFNTGDVFTDYKLCLLGKWRDIDGNGGATGNARHSRKPIWTYRGAPPWKREMWHLNLNDFPPYNRASS